MPDIRGTIALGLVWRFLEHIGSELISFILSIVLARLLAPSDFGVIAMVMVFISFANVFIIAGLGTALVQKKDVDEVDYSSVFFFNLALSFFIYFAIFLLSPIISKFFHVDNLSPILRILSLSIPVSAMVTVQNAIIQRQMTFRQSFNASIIGTVCGAVTGISLAYLGYGVWSLVTQQLLTRFINMIILWTSVKWRPVLKFSALRIGIMHRYSWKILVGGLIDSVYNESRSLFIGKIYTASDLAFYSKGMSFPRLIISNIDATISSVLFPALSASQDDVDIVKALTRRAVKTSSYIIWPLMMGLAVISDKLIPLLLTEKWIRSIPYLKVACVYYALFPICTSNMQAIKAMGHSDIYLKLEIVKKVIGIVLMLLAVRISVMAVVLSTLVTTIIAMFLNAIPSSKLIAYGIKEQLLDLLPSALVTLAMVIVVLAVSYLPLSDFFVLILQLFFGVVSYLLMSRVFHIEAFEYVIALLQQIKRRDSAPS